MKTRTPSRLISATRAETEAVKIVQELLACQAVMTMKELVELPEIKRPGYGKFDLFTEKRLKLFRLIHGLQNPNQKTEIDHATMRHCGNFRSRI